MDKIQIIDLTVLYHVGVPDEERAQTQRLLVSVEMDCDFSQAALDDDLAKTINYYSVTRRILQFGDGRNWKLLERLAVELAEMILMEFKPARVSIEIKKFIIPEARYVGVQIIRHGHSVCD